MCWTTQDYISPSGSRDQAYNGYRVFLSSPTHSDSRYRGECRPPSYEGYEENVNGRKFNWYAANGNYRGWDYVPNSVGRNLHSRGYQVIVSINGRDDSWPEKQTTVHKLGSEVHIVTHSNAVADGCPSSASYLLTMYYNGQDRALGSAIRGNLSPEVPGSSVEAYRSDLGELRTDREYGDAYVELQFHTNVSAQAWMYGSSHRAAYAYGLGVDSHLGYP